MKIERLEVSGFRAFTEAAAFDLAADAVIVIGGNGQGKTSFFDSILWAFTGKVPRLKTDDNGLRSLFSVSGEMRVLLSLTDHRGAHYEILRSFDGLKQNLRFKVGDTIYVQDAARLKLLESLWSGAPASTDGDASLSAAYVRSVYLQQDLVRQFIDADDDQERFNVVSELVGAGRVTELQLQLERSKTAWVKALNQRIEELQLLKQRLSASELQQSKLGSQPSKASISNTWPEWWKIFTDSTGLQMEVPPPESLDAATTLDTAIRRLQAVLQSNERNKQMAITLLSELTATNEPPLPGSLQQLEESVRERRREADTLRRELLYLQSKAAELRSSQLQITEQWAALRTFAQLALRHLGDHCPVCEQEYDKEATRKRLLQIAEQKESTNGASVDLESAIRSTSDRLSIAERHLMASEASLQSAKRAHDEYTSRKANRDAALNQLGIGPVVTGQIAPIVERYVKEADIKSKNLQSLMKTGERLALSIAQATEEARKEELQRDIAALKVTIGQAANVVNGQQETEKLASEILEGLREASTEVVRNQLERIEPLLQRVYSRIDVHPAFRNVKFLTRFSNRRGRLFASIVDRVGDVTSLTPAAVLSSSQMNALAVAIFLSLNLGLPRLPLDSVLLDDPLQSLDDVNLLGLVDLLRRTKDRRQLLVSTHDIRFGRLLERKLRAVGHDQRTTIVEFSGWQRSGPVFSQRDVSRDERPMKIAVA